MRAPLLQHDRGPLRLLTAVAAALVRREPHLVARDGAAAVGIGPEDDLRAADGRSVADAGAFPMLATTRSRSPPASRVQPMSSSGSVGTRLAPMAQGGQLATEGESRR